MIISYSFILFILIYFYYNLYDIYFQFIFEIERLRNRIVILFVFLFYFIGKKSNNQFIDFIVVYFELCCIYMYINLVYFNKGYI